LRLALHALTTRLPRLRLAGKPAYADIYHFHGLRGLMVAPS
jgi:hypothetical protein